MGKTQTRRRRTEGEVRELRTPCPNVTCRSEDTVVLEKRVLRDIPYRDPQSGVVYPGRVRRRRRCNDCGRIFFANQGLNGSEHKT